MKIKTRIFALLLVVMCLFSSVVPAFAHDAYFLSVTIDPASLQYMAYVSYDDTGWIDGGIGEHSENRLNAIFSMASGWSSHISTYESLLSGDEDKTEELRKFYIGDKSNKGTVGMAAWDSSIVPDDASMAFTFPSWHPGWWSSLWGAGVSCEKSDETLANRSAQAVNGLNSCLNFISSRCYTQKSPTMQQMQVLAAKVATYAEANYNSGTGTGYNINGKTVTFAKATSVKPDATSGFQQSDYIKVTIDGVTQEYLWRSPKGYYEDLGSGRTDKGMSTSKSSSYLSHLRSGSAKDVKFITWNLIVMQGNYNADVSKVTFATLEEIVNPGVFTSLIGGLVKWAVSSISSALQLKPYEDFFLMRGVIASDWVYGMFPEGWSAPMMLLYSVCLTIAMSLIGFSILKILWKKQLSTVNIGEKIAMQESIKNLIVTLFLFFAFIPIFIFLAGLNAALVQLFSSAVVSGAMTSLITISYVSFGSICLGVAELILKIYFNFFYVTRGITIAVLVGISPLAIYTLSLGGKTSGVFTAFMKELISQIFTQTVHAIIAAFFFNALSYAAMTPFEKIVVLYAFIPITKFVKTKVFLLSEGPAGQVASAGAGLAAGAMGGAAKAATSGGGGHGRGGGGGGDSGGGGKSGGGGGGLGGGSGEGILSGAMDRAAGQQRSNALKTGTVPSMSDGATMNKNQAGYRPVYASGRVPTGTQAPQGFRQGPSGAGGGVKMADAGGNGLPAGNNQAALPGGSGGGMIPYNPNAVGAHTGGSGGGIGPHTGGGVGPHTGGMGGGNSGGSKMFYTGAMDKEAYSALGKMALGSVGNMAAGALYGGLALGMGAIGENPTKYAEASARHFATGQKMGASALYQGYQYERAGGLRDQAIMSMEEAGITGMATNGSFNKYNVDATNASPQHQAIYSDLRKAYSPGADGSFTDQQQAAQTYYRDNYGVQNVNVRASTSNPNMMSIDMEASKMVAHRISETDPFEQMRAFKWKNESDDKKK